MSMTLDQIVEETRHWPKGLLGELIDRLSEELHPTELGVDDAWKAESRRRLAEIESGLVKSVDGDEVSARVRQIVGR